MKFPALLVFMMQRVVLVQALILVEEKLHRHLFEAEYNKEVRPTLRSNDVINVTIRLTVSQLVDIDEQRLTMTTSVWVHQSWTDANLRWNPEHFSNITSIRIPHDFIWIPDIVLMENADGNFTIKENTKAILNYDGRVTWSPPATYKSTCPIDATFFPFDVQNCTMKFASWSYDTRQVRILAADEAFNLQRLRSNGEWDIVDIHVETSEGEYIVSENDHHSIFSHSKIVYYFFLRRLPLFYCTFLIAPCLGISFFTSLVFYLPSASQEKVTLCISVLLAHIFFLLVITEIMPASSKDIPLIAEYLLLNMIFITLSIILTTVVLNVHYRSITTHRSLLSCVRIFALHIAPKLLWMELPDLRTLHGVNVQRLTKGLLFKRENLIMGRHLLRELKRSTNMPDELCEELGGAIETAFFIAERIKRKIHQEQEAEEWRFVANVLDRIFSILFLIVSFLGSTILIIPAWADKSYLHSSHNDILVTEHGFQFSLFS